MRITTLCCCVGVFLVVPRAWSLDLAEAYQLALANDPDLKIAEAAVESAKEAKPQAKALLLPNISIGGEVNAVKSDTKRSFSGADGINSYHDNLASLSLVQPVYRRDRWIQLEQTDDTIASAEAEYADAQQSLIFRTADAYFGILEAMEDVTFSQQNKKAIARQLDQAKQRFEVGLIAITDVHEAQAAYDNAVSEEISALNSVDTAWEALLQIIGPRPQEELARLRKEIPLKPPEPADIDAWAETAQKQNLTIIAALYNSELARKNIDLQRAGHYPTLDLVGTYGAADTGGSFEVRQDSSVIGLQLSLPLYQGGGVNAAVRQAQYDFQGAQENLNSQRRAVNKLVKDSYRGVETTISRVRALAATVVSFESALEATEAGYEVGTRTIIDVLNVQSGLFDAKRNWAVARYNYILAGLSLRLAASILKPENIETVNGWLEPALASGTATQ